MSHPQRARLIAAATALATLTLTGSAGAQWTPTLDVIDTLSNFTWSGTTSLGPLVGTPGNSFQMDGTASVSLSPVGSQSLGTGQFLGADAYTVPDIAGQIPNVLPFLPPLATFSVTNLHVSVTSDPFAISPTGAFTAVASATVLSGTLNVTPLVGSATSDDLTGLVSDPTPQTGQTLVVAGNLQLSSMFDSTFPFDDPASGISGSITLTGDLVARWTCPAPATYCTTQVNSQGCAPAIGTSGMASYADPAPFLVEATDLLNQKTGLLFYGYGQQATAFGGGTMCVTSPRKRTPIQSSGGTPVGSSDCSGTFSLDFNARIQSGVDPMLEPGAVVYAQYWSRDPQASGTTTNLTDAVQFTGCP